MVTFPGLAMLALSRGCVQVEVVRRTQVVRFLDGGEQRFAEQGQTLRRWTLRFEELREAELGALTEFVRTVGGRTLPFAFTDPETEIVYPRCRLDRERLAVRLDGEQRGEAELVVVEEPS